MLLAVPVEQAFCPSLPALHHQRDEELVGFQVMCGVQGVVADRVAALDVGALIVAVPVGEHPGPPRRDQEQGMTTLDARGFDDFPGVDEAELFEVLKTHLTGAKAGEEEFLDLEGVQVAVVVEALQDDKVALGERSMETSEL